MVEYIRTLNDSVADADTMFDMWRRLSAGGELVEFDFSACRFLRQNAVAFLGGLARLIHHRGGEVIFRWETLGSAISANLGQNGFKGAFGDQFGPWRGNSIPFREDTEQRAHEFEDYLSRLWLGRGWVSVSPALRDAIVGRMAEIYLNAFDHGQSPIGVFVCGQHFPKNHELTLTIVDFGVGIPSNVRSFMAHEYQPTQLPGSTCMEWAFQRGTTTKPGMGRGLGLDLLQDFVRLNGGRLEMFSHEGYALVADGNVSFDQRTSFFEGTLVNICLQCDEKYYCLASELPNEPLF